MDIFLLIYLLLQTSLLSLANAKLRLTPASLRLTLSDCPQLRRR